MILSWILYTATLTALVAAGTWALDRLLRDRGKPTRALWAAGMALVVVGSVYHAVPRPTSEAEPIAAVMLFPEFPVVAEWSTLPPTTSIPTDWDALALRGWGLLSLLALLYLTVGAVGTAKARRRWESAEIDGRRVFLSESVGPALVGWLRPEIVVPRWVLRASAEERILTLLHEEEHRSAGDHRLLAAAVLLTALAPWNVPLLWMAARLRLAIELDCDRRVLRKNPRVAPYARLLLHVAERSVGNGRPAMALAHPRTSLERRIHAMTSVTTPRRLTTGGLALLGGLLFVGACHLDQLPTETDAEALEQQIEQESGPFRIDIRSDQGGMLTGTVALRDSGDPAESVQISIPALNMGGLSNNQGRFVLLNLPGGEYDVRFEHSDYGMQLLSATVAEPEPVEQAIESRLPTTANPPLIVVDGEVTDLELGDIASLDVSSIEIVKSGPGLERWGQRAENGVVVIRLREEGEGPRAPTLPRTSTAEGTGTITGSVVDPATGQPLASVQVFITKLQVGGLTNNQGRFLLLNVPAGTHTVEFQTRDLLGKEAVEIDVVVGESANVGSVEIARNLPGGDGS